MFETLIRDAAERLGLGAQAQRFIGMLLGLIFDRSTGGFAGLQDRFGQAGLGDLFSSWIGREVGDNVLQPDQFQGAFGASIIESLARKLGLPASAVSIAGATLLPKLVGLLTPGGTIPTAPPAEAEALIARIDGDRPAVPLADYDDGMSGSGSGWMKWLIPLLLIVGAFLVFRNCRQEAPVTELPPAVEPAAVELAPEFGFENTDGQVTVNGRLATEGERGQLWDALTAAFGDGNVHGDITIDPATLPAGWLDRLVAALPDLQAAGLKFGFSGDDLTIDTSALPEEERFAISEKLRSAFGGFSISGLWSRASAALAGLAEGFSGDDLVGALNLMQVHFDTGSATITRDSQEILSTAAQAIQAAPEGTRIEVGGHTDNTGDAAANQALSEQRADAVAVRLAELGVAEGVLSARGYGQDNPVADNDTEEGRAQNRRIEFTVVQ